MPSQLWEKTFGTNRAFIEREINNYEDYPKNDADLIDWLAVESKETLRTLLLTMPDEWLDAPASQIIKSIEGRTQHLYQASKMFEKFYEEVLKASLEDLDDFMNQFKINA